MEGIENNVKKSKGGCFSLAIQSRKKDSSNKSRG